MQCLPGASTAHWQQQQQHDAGSNFLAAPPMLAAAPLRAVHGVLHEEETSVVSFGSNGTKKRSAESCPKLKRQGSYNSGTEDSNSKKKENITKQSKNEKALENTSKGKSKPAPETDYIHVRARRGQATDSHSLAERVCIFMVRREKISERMRYLQYLVPGCNMIMGKASMLDEIINYVQSLQRQVEFLSMKLSAVSPGMHFIDRELSSSCNTSGIPVIGIQQNDQLNISGLELDPLQPTNSCSGLNMPMNSLESVLQRTITPVAVPCTLLDSYFNVNGSTAWDAGFQGFCGVEFQQGSESAFPSQSLQGSVLPSNLKEM